LSRAVNLRAVRWRLAGVIALTLLVAGFQGAVQQAASAAPRGPSSAGAAPTASMSRAAARSVPAADAGMATRGAAAAEALSKARSGGQATEILADRTPFSQTFANPNGSFTTMTSVQPRWVASGSSWVTADATLVQASNGSWKPRAALGGLTLSGGGGDVLATARSGGQWFSVTWPQALPAPTVSGATATYANVFPGVNLLVTAGLTGGFSDTMVISDKSAAADPQLSGLTLGVSASAGLTRHSRQAGSIAEESAGGQSVFYSPPPVGWKSGTAGAGAGGPGIGEGVLPVPAAYSSASVQVSVPASLLSAPASAFPEYVDPAYSQTPAWENYGELQANYPTTNELDGTYDGDVSAGYDGGGIDRGEYVFGLPAAADSAAVTIVSATMTATAVKTFTNSSTSHTVNASYVTQYSSTSTWDDPPTLIAGPSAQTFTTASTAPDQNVSWNAASWLQTAYNSSAFQMTVQLANSNETDSGPFVEFGPSPTLTFNYTQPAPAVPVGTGPVSNATFLSFPVSDKVSLQVNVGSGNALVTTSDLTLPEADGAALTLGNDYNSLLVNSVVNRGADSDGWRQREGVDVRLYLGSSGTITFLGEDGTAGTFTAPTGTGTTYGSPAVFHATLTSAPGSACSGSAYQLTWHSTGEAMCFNGAGLLTSQADRNGNTTTFSYNGSGQETQITYTPDGLTSPTETVTATYTGGDLTGLSESGGSTGTKTVTYGINANGDLTSVQQPDGTTITLGYDGSHDLTSIENGAGATTQLAYNSSEQVTSVSQPYGSGATATTRLSYVSATETQVATPTTNQSDSVSSVPNTTYTISSQDLVTHTLDPGTHTTTTGYNAAFNETTTATNQLGGATTKTYTSNSGESLNGSASPTGATTKLDYTTPAAGGGPEYEYLPSSSTDAQGNATAYLYKGEGNLSTATNAQSAAASVTSNADGTPQYSTDPDTGKTTYSYNSLHQLTTVTPPPAPTNGSLKPISLTYDGFGRVSTVTDGDGNTVTYTYDLADRITKQAYTGGPNPLIVTYAYDGAGNLTTQTDPSGTTGYTYDGRNQVLTKNAASGGGTLTYGYDADGNMVSAQDAGGTTSYTYNELDQLTSLTDSASKLWEFAYNAAGERTTTWFDTNTAESTWAAKFITSYDAGGRISRIQDYRDSSTADVVSDVTYCYSKYVSGTACPAQTAANDTSLVQYSVNNQASVVSVYTYDKGNRLSGVTNDNGATYSYSYNGDGGVLTGANRGAESYNFSNQITNTGYTYDGAGNLATTPSGGDTLTYNDAGQWTAATATTGTENFTYAGSSQDQVLSDGSATGITYGIAGQDGQPWIQSYTPAGSATDYVIRDQQGDPLGYVQGGASSAFATDNIGSVTSVIGTAGTVEAGYTYDPYGHGNTPTGADAADNLLQYTGALQDTDSNYTHLGDRWYNPVTDNFTTQDANSYLASPANGNRYAYAADNPANYTDPTGHGILDDITTVIVGTSVGLFVFGSTGNPLLAAGLGGCAGGATSEFLGGGDSAAIAGGCMVGLTGGVGGYFSTPS
jgi:RHS repeat-associated protein